MAILASVLENLLTRAGIDTKNEAFLKLIQSKELSTIELGDELTQPLNSLITVADAKRNIELKNHFYASALDPLDSKVKEWAKEHGIEEADLTDILSDKSTFNRVDKAVKKIAELKSKAAGADNKGDKEKYVQQIKELSDKITAITAEKTTELNGLKAKYESDLLEMEDDIFLSKQPLPGIYAADVERKMAKMFIAQELEKHNAKKIKKDGKIKIVAKDDENFPILVESKELDYETLTTAALAGNKFLKVKDAGNNQQNQNQNAHNNNGENKNQNPHIQDVHASLDSFYFHNANLLKISFGTK